MFVLCPKGGGGQAGVRFQVSVIGSGFRVQRFRFKQFQCSAVFPFLMLFNLSTLNVEPLNPGVDPESLVYLWKARR